MVKIFKLFKWNTWIESIKAETEPTNNRPNYFTSFFSVNVDLRIISLWWYFFFILSILSTNHYEKQNKINVSQRKTHSDFNLLKILSSISHYLLHYVELIFLILPDFIRWYYDDIYIYITIYIYILIIF